MSKEKQIEEMTNDLRKSEHWFFDDTDCDFELDRKKTAENLYNAGYRKQIEGEWELEHETYGKMRCSVCGKECPTERKPDPYEDYQMTDFYITSPFCPNCGAKMKGGAEE